MSNHELFRGDLVSPAQDPGPPWGIVRAARRSHVLVQVGKRSRWIHRGQLAWNGSSYEGRLPRTPWGWRRLALAIAEHESGLRIARGRS